MNRFLHNIDWHNHIDYNDIFTCWNNFKNILSCACDQYIPTITVKDDRNRPWFDAEVHKLCIKKERLRSQYFFLFKNFKIVLHLLHKGHI